MCVGSHGPINDPNDMPFKNDIKEIYSKKQKFIGTDKNVVVTVGKEGGGRWRKGH